MWAIITFAMRTSRRQAESARQPDNQGDSNLKISATAAFGLPSGTKAPRYKIKQAAFGGIIPLIASGVFRPMLTRASP